MIRLQDSRSFCPSVHEHVSGGDAHKCKLRLRPSPPWESHHVRNQLSLVARHSTLIHAPPSPCERSWVVPTGFTFKFWQKNRGIYKWSPHGKGIWIGWNLTLKPVNSLHGRGQELRESLSKKGLPTSTKHRSTLLQRVSLTLINYPLKIGASYTHHWHLLPPAVPATMASAFRRLSTESAKCAAENLSRSNSFYGLFVRQGVGGFWTEGGSKWKRTKGEMCSLAVIWGWMEIVRGWYYYFQRLSSSSVKMTQCEGRSLSSQNQDALSNRMQLPLSLYFSPTALAVALGSSASRPNWDVVFCAPTDLYICLPVSYHLLKQMAVASEKADWRIPPSALYICPTVS